MATVRNARWRVFMEASRETTTVAEAARMLGLSVASAYRAIESGEIPSIRIGGRILVPRSRLVALIRGKGLGRFERGDAYDR
jgi:excisionase family DNA binding protein